MTDFMIANNGTASEGAMNDLRDIVDETPEFFQLALQHRGYRIELGRDMKNRHPDLVLDDDVAGFYAPTIKYIFLAENEKPNLGGRYNHELGHFADLEILGTDEWPSGYFSLTQDFQEAWQKDINELHVKSFSPVRDLSVEMIGRDYSGEDQEFFFNAFMLQDHFMKTMQNPKEVAAELFCNNRGYTANMPYDVSAIFPACNRILLDRLAPYLG